MDNYIKYCIMGAPTKLKRDVLPHIFNCQPDRPRTSADLSRPAFLKLNRKRNIDEILIDTENKKEDGLTKSNPPNKFLHLSKRAKTSPVLNEKKRILADTINTVSYTLLLLYILY